jgi:hypothetical protein
MSVSLSSNTASAYYNSPFFAPGLYLSMAPVNQDLPTQPIPKLSPGDTIGDEKYREAVNAYRLYEVFDDRVTAHTYVNSDDGAVITITPDYVDARSVDQHHLYYDRKTGTEIYYEVNRALILHPDGGIEAIEYS